LYICVESIRAFQILFPAVKTGNLVGNLGTGITISVKIPKVTGSISLLAKNKGLWIDFDMHVFGKNHKATFNIQDLPFMKGDLKEHGNVWEGFEAANIDAVETA